MHATRSVFFALCIVICFSVGFTPVSLAQTETATISGRIVDVTGAIVRGASVELRSVQRGAAITTTTNGTGIYVFPTVSPGQYSVTVRKQGFKQVDLVGVVANVQDHIEQNFRLDIGSASESVTVSADTNNINTTDASVGTVIDREFVQDLPMNGRSFQTLVLLSPGVVTNNPNGADSGEYSVNGQRTDSNGFQVDGASASNAPSYASTGGSSAMLPSATALGTTQAMLQVDAMEEFRISTSTFSAEFGNHPGAQVSFRSRSGTSMFHGTAFDYLRNAVFDANNWFNTYSTPAVPTPQEHQNDFGGTLGGPLSIPHLYSGRDRTFFFFSYEGLRLDTPQASSIYDVPSNGTHITANYSANPQWANLRQYGAKGVLPFLNSFPLPNCDTSIDPQCVDYGQGGTAYISSPPSSGLINALSARVDYQASSWMRLFARYSDSISNTTTVSTSGPFQSTALARNRTWLLGVDSSFGAKVSNELRLQYAPASFIVPNKPVQVGGAQPYSFYQAQGIDTGETYARFYSPNAASNYEETYGRLQFQPNVTDSITWMYGKHLFKFGGAYVQTTSYFDGGELSRSPLVDYHFTAATVVSGVPGTQQVNVFTRQDPTIKQLGLFAQDEWRVLPRLSLSMGLRWELAPPPSVSGTQSYTYTGNVNDPSSLGLSALGAPLYQTKYTNFAPRIGVALVMHNEPGHELVLRAGGGLFYDGIALTSTFGNGYLLGSQSVYSYKTQFPLQASQLLVPVVKPKAPYSFVFYPANNIVPPYTLQWNVSLEQALGSKQTLTVGYIAANGRRLNTLKTYSLSKLNNNFATFELFTNGPGSSYNSLQMKYQRQMSYGLQALAAYTWAHAIDWASSATTSSIFPLQKGNSDHDVRHNFTVALLYNIPANYSNGLKKAVLGHWNADLWFIARSAFPFEPQGPNVTDPITGDVISGQLNYNGKNPYIYKPGIPGGRQVDPTIFSVTTTALGVGTAPRNFLRGFGEAQANVAIQRDFPLHERAKLQFRAEAFNLTNHPAFGKVSLTCGSTASGATCNSPLMGQATTTLNTGLGNLNSLYQQGGPRSLEFMLKLQF